MNKGLADYREEVIKAMIGLPREKIDEVIDFISYLKMKEGRKRKKEKTYMSDMQNPLLSIVGIGESDYPHDLAQSHDKYVYSGDV